MADTVPIFIHIDWAEHWAAGFTSWYDPLFAWITSCVDNSFLLFQLEVLFWDLYFMSKRLWLYLDWKDCSQEFTEMVACLLFLILHKMACFFDIPFHLKIKHTNTFDANDLSLTILLLPLYLLCTIQWASKLTKILYTHLLHCVLAVLILQRTTKRAQLLMQQFAKFSKSFTKNMFTDTLACLYHGFRYWLFCLWFLSSWGWGTVFQLQYMKSNVCFISDSYIDQNSSMELNKGSTLPMAVAFLHWVGNRLVTADTGKGN